MIRRVTHSIVAIVAIYSTSATQSKAQEYKKGDEVVALRHAELKVEKRVVGTIRRGEKLAIENVRSDWLWVRHGQTRGWIESTAVVAPDLLAHYQRRPEGSVAQIWGGVRTKINGIAFRIETDGRRTTIQKYRDGIKIKGGTMDAVIGKVGDRSCAFSVNGKRYAQVQRGDYVFVRPSQEVYVNGGLRTPQ